MTLFEAPATHEANHYHNPYANQEFEDEWEAQEATHYHQEFEDEWEATPAAQYSNPYANQEFEDEWEATPAAQYSNPYANQEFEDEWEAYSSNPYTNQEFEDEGEYFFKKAFSTVKGGLKKFAKVAAPIAKRMAPKLVSSLVSMIPGAGPLLSGAAGNVTRALLREAEMETLQMEAEFFGTNEAEAEVANTETAHEAALTEFLAAQAAEAATEAEAEAAIAATLPITISIVGGRRALRHVMPAMTQATARLTKEMIRQGGKGLLPLMPTVLRQSANTLKAINRSGQPINSATAVKAMASATRRVMNNPQRVQQALVRNTVLRQRTAPPSPRMATTRAGHCPTCAAKAR